MGAGLRVLVRPAATPEEVDASGRFVQAAYAEYGPGSGASLPAWDAYERQQLDAATRAREGTVLVAVDPAAGVVGTATLYLEPTPSSEHWRRDDAVMRFLAVLPAHRGRGIGRALLDECIRLATEAGRARLALHTAPPMATATAMYLRAGFVRDPAGDLAVGSLPILAYALELPRAR